MRTSLLIVALTLLSACAARGPGEAMETYQVARHGLVPRHYAPAIADYRKAITYCHHDRYRQWESWVVEEGPRSITWAIGARNSAIIQLIRISDEGARGTGYEVRVPRAPSDTSQPDYKAVHWLNGRFLEACDWVRLPTEDAQREVDADRRRRTAVGPPMTPGMPQ